MKLNASIALFSLGSSSLKHSIPGSVKKNGIFSGVEAFVVRPNNYNFRSGTTTLNRNSKVSALSATNESDDSGISADALEVHTNVPVDVDVEANDDVDVDVDIPAPSDSVVQEEKNQEEQIKEATPASAVVEEMPTSNDLEIRRQKVKASLFASLGSKPLSSKLDMSDKNEEKASVPVDPILADPETKELLMLQSTGTLIGGQSKSTPSVKVILQSTSENASTYQGRSNTYYDLLAESALDNAKDAGADADVGLDDTDTNTNTITDVVNSFRVFIPPPVRNILATTGVLPGDDYIPMRDLFTSPQVSFAYERGWRQGFAAAGFPGADKEYELVKEYFASGDLDVDTVVDMSCATGLFTRRLAKGGDYERVVGCDYSESMLTEARRRIEADEQLKNASGDCQLDLVRCDVGNIPMGTETVPALHAGAAMHCWPDLDAALSEIHRVLKPGGRFFASTFLAAYFATVQAAGGTDINSQAFQYFESVDMLRELFLKAGFEDEKVDIEVLGTSCVLIRAEK